MRILLIEPPSPYTYGAVRILGSMGSLKTDMAWPPYDLMILSGFFDKCGIESKIIDANSTKMHWKDVKKLISLEKPEFVIFNATLPTLGNDVSVAKITKEVSQDIFTAVFNLSIQSTRENILKKYPDLDFVIYSEPELPLYELIINRYNPKNIRGIYYRDNGSIKKTEPYPTTTNLDVFGIPKHCDIPLKIYKDPLMRQRPMTIVNCSRGCSGVCNHCLSMFQRPLRYRSIENVTEELDDIKSLAIKEIKFFDCGLTNDVHWANTLFEKMLQKGYRFSWNCNCRADCLPIDTLKLMRRSGCHTISIGSESANQQILDRMGKGMKIGQIEEVVKNCKKIGIRPMLYFTFGLMGETKESIRESIEFAKRMNPEIVTFGIVVPVYGTPFYKYLETKGYLFNKDESTYDPNNPPPYSYPLLSSQEIYNMARQGYREFYLRPNYIIHRFFQMRNIWDVKNNLSNFIAFLRRYIGKD